VKKFERLDSTRAPDGTVLTLFRHDGAYSIRADGVELMSTRRHHSEDRLAEAVCAPLRDTPGVHVLVGGLGLGFTLRAALRILPPDARVVVAELVAGIIAWNENPDYALAGSALRDGRVDLRHADVATVLAENPATFDAIMLDVDNGPAALTTAGNARLYQRSGIATSAAALRPNGRLAYWSAGEEPKFERSLRGAGLVVETTRVWSHGTSGHLHTLFVAHTA
jgi:spermidine synthase